MKTFLRKQPHVWDKCSAATAKRKKTPTMAVQLSVVKRFAAFFDSATPQYYRRRLSILPLPCHGTPLINAWENRKVRNYRRIPQQRASSLQSSDFNEAVTKKSTQKLRTNLLGPCSHRKLDGAVPPRRVPKNIHTIVRRFWTEHVNDAFTEARPSHS